MKFFKFLVYSIWNCWLIRDSWKIRNKVIKISEFWPQKSFHRWIPYLIVWDMIDIIIKMIEFMFRYDFLNFLSSEFHKKTKQKKALFILGNNWISKRKIKELCSWPNESCFFIGSWVNLSLLWTVFNTKT